MARAALLVLMVFAGGCAADGLPDNPSPSLAIASTPVADMAKAIDMTPVGDMDQTPQQTGDMTESPEPTPPPLDCGYAIGGKCCADGSCAVGQCDETGHCN